MKLAAVDPGPATTGLAVLLGDQVIAHQTIRRGKKEISTAVMKKTIAWLDEQRPDIVVIEGYFPEGWRQTQPLQAHAMSAFVCELTIRICALGLPYFIVHQQDRIVIPQSVARMSLGSDRASEHVVDAIRHAIAAKLTATSILQERKRGAL